MLLLFSRTPPRWRTSHADDAAEPLAGPLRWHVVDRRGWQARTGRAVNAWSRPGRVPEEFKLDVV